MSFSLTKTRKNAVMQAILDVGLSPMEFEWARVPSGVINVGGGRDPWLVDVLLHRPTRYSFLFDVDEHGSLWVSYLPGPEGSRYRSHSGGWEQVLDAVGSWLEAVRDEHGAPDLWTALESHRELLAGEETNNSPFTPDEQRQIETRLGELKTYARATLELEPAQLEKIEANLDYLVEAAQREGRIDWRNLLLGSLISLALQAVVPVDAVQQLIIVLFRSLANVFGTEQPDLPGGGLLETM